MNANQSKFDTNFALSFSPLCSTFFSPVIGCLLLADEHQAEPRGISPSGIPSSGIP
jgi:hypothetical protein